MKTIQKEIDEEIEAPNAVVEKRRQVREHYRFLTIKKRLFFIGIIISLLLLVSQYFLSGASNVTKIYVEGEYYLPKSYVQNISGITTNSKYFFVVGPLVQQRIEKDPFIKSVTVSHGKHGIIELAIEEEKMVAYRMDTGFEILLGNGSYEVASDDLVEIISSLPLLVGFEETEAIETLAEYLGEVNHNIIENISEIHRYEMSYDSNMIRILMRDGNHIFTSFYSLDTLNHYYSLIPNIANKGACIYVDEISKQVYTSRCPWDEEEASDEQQEAEPVE